MNGIYIHIPFCDGKCPYCDFYSMSADDSQKDLYVKALLKAIKDYPSSFAADSIYFGGGTPCLMGEKRILQIIDAIYKKFSIAKNSEITLEANPHAVNKQMLSQLFRNGVNRISFGVQSTHDRILKILGRKHTAKEAFDAVTMAYNVGFKHISADLMLSVPSQTPSDITEDINNLALLPLDHISAYILKLEPNTIFFKKYCEPDDDFVADNYLMAVNELQKAGFIQYEISNFAKNKEAQSKHNLKYWLLDDYLGIGPSAHSLINGKRFYFERSLEKFLTSENVWNNWIFEDTGNTHEEKIMLNLRLKSGLDCSFFGYKGKLMLEESQKFKNAGLINQNGNVISLTPKGFLVSNAIISQLIETFGRE